MNEKWIKVGDNYEVRCLLSTTPFFKHHSKESKLQENDTVKNLWDAMLRTQGSAGSSKNYEETHRRIFGKFGRSGTNGKDAYTKFLNMTVSEDCPKRAPWVVR